MKNPYEVLGVTQNATDDEIKAKYRELAKKYHPDNYNDSPLADLAEEKMKEVNEAYDSIMEMRKNGTNGNSYSGGYSNSGYSQYVNVRSLIQQNRIDEAEKILDSEQGNKNAEWYFLRGMCYFHRGWTQQATQYFQHACQMDPGNMEYRQALNNMTRQQGFGYGGYNTDVPAGGGCSMCDICSGLMCLDCMCDCC